jgi:ATP adenylyltransferase
MGTRGVLWSIRTRRGGAEVQILDNRRHAPNWRIYVISPSGESCASLTIFWSALGARMGNTSIETWSAAGGGRFASLLSSDTCERRSYDQPILETADCVVAPTLGSILPGWLLVVPRRPALNFREWNGGSNRSATGLIEDVLNRLEVRPERTIWFEHGPSTTSSLVGCGIDYAHIHLLVDQPFSFDKFIFSVLEVSTLHWRRCPATDAFGSINSANSYLVAGSQDSAAIAEQVEAAGSQFFRRVVAQLMNIPQQWDYNHHPHLHNVQKTIAAFPRQRALTAVS